MFTTAGPTCLTMLENWFGEHDGVGNGERLGVAGVNMLLHGADAASEHRASEKADRKHTQHGEGGGQVPVAQVLAQAREEAGGGCFVLCVNHCGFAFLHGSRVILRRVASRRSLCVEARKCFI